MRHHGAVIGLAILLVFGTMTFIPLPVGAVLYTPTLGGSGTINGTGTFVNLPFVLPSDAKKLLLFVDYVSAGNPCTVGTNTARFGENGPLTSIACSDSDGYRNPIQVFEGSATSCTVDCTYFRWMRTSSTSVILNGQAWEKASTNTSAIKNHTASAGMWFPEVGTMAHDINGIAITHANSVYVGGLTGVKFNAAQSYPISIFGNAITGIGSSDKVCWDTLHCYASGYTTGNNLTFQQEQINKAWAFNTYVVEIEGLDIPPQFPWELQIMDLFAVIVFIVFVLGGSVALTVWLTGRKQGGGV